jgi:hypothetical protein
MPLEVMIPHHLISEYEELTRHYSRMKFSWAGSSNLFNKLTTYEAALILPLQKHLVCTV